MDSIDSLKKHLESAKNLKQIVSTMKALSATNIKKYEKTALSLNKYTSNIYVGLQGILLQNKDILDYIDSVEKNNERDINKQNIVIVIGSNQGLCGKFNDKIVNFFIENSKNIDFTKENNLLITIGDKIQSTISAQGINIFRHITLPNSIENIVHIVYNIFTLINEYSKKSQNVYLYFTQHDTKSNGILTKKKVIPLEKEFFKKILNKKWPTNNVPFWRVDTKTLFSDFIEQYIFISIYYAIANSMASEQKNRLTTLQGAEDNIKNNITETTLRYNQMRQSIITSDLIDVVSGYKLLRKKKI